jgi:hypothetical protein
MEKLFPPFSVGGRMGNGFGVVSSFYFLFLIFFIISFIYIYISKGNNWKRKGATQSHKKNTEQIKNKKKREQKSAYLDTGFGVV